MLFTSAVLFLHVPKTGGRSVTEFLENNLRGSMEESLGAAAAGRERRFAFDDVAERVTVFEGRRHEDVAQAIAVLEQRGLRLADFEQVVSVIRNPYDLEVSYYEHLRKPRVVARRGPGSVPVQAAASGDFLHFVRHAPFFGHLPAEIERYYTHDGEVPANFRLVRFESLADELPALVAPYSFDRWAFPHVNASEERSGYRSYLTPEVEQAIYDKYRYLFEHYPREVVD